MSDSHVPTRWQATLPRRRARTKIFSASGKTPIPIIPILKPALPHPIDRSLRILMVWSPRRRAVAGSSRSRAGTATLIPMRSLMPRTTWVIALIVLLSWLLTLSAVAQEGPLDPSQPKGSTPEQIIQRFAAKEKEFKEARDQYTYRQEVKVQTLDGSTVTGEYQEVFDVGFNDQGRRLENVVFAPQSSLENGGISITKEDLADIRNRLPFVLTSDEVPEYNILYVGQQQEDEMHCYVFDIAPKTIEKDKRYFQGRV